MRRFFILLIIPMIVSCGHATDDFFMLKECENHGKSYTMIKEAKNAPVLNMIFYINENTVEPAYLWSVEGNGAPTVDIEDDQGRPLVYGNQDNWRWNSSVNISQVKYFKVFAINDRDGVHVTLRTCIR